MKKTVFQKLVTRSISALLGGLIGLSPLFVPSVIETVQAAVTAGSGEYVSGVTYSHNSKFEGYTIVNGIDVSSYQKTVDWNAVKADGIDFAFIRVGFRGYGESGTLNPDGKYAQNLENAVKAGVKVGVYIYSQAITVEEGIAEANFILERIKGYDVTLPVVIDYEYAATGLGRLYNANLTKRQATDICAAFCETVKAAGYTPMIYANKYMLSSKLYADELDDKYQIWLANYTSKTTYDGDYQYWQYSSSGQVDGITTGRVDVNFFYTLDSSYQDIKIDHQSAEPTDVDATIRVNLQNPGGGIVSQVGFSLYDASGSLIGTYNDTCSYSSDSVNYVGKLSDYGVKLSARTSYTYQPFAKVGANTYYGTKQSFTTTEPTVTVSETVISTETNALIAAEFANPATTLIEAVGYTLYSAVGAKLGSYQSNLNATDEVISIQFDIAAQTGISLIPGTTYQYEIYSVHDGKTDKVVRKTFTTLTAGAITEVSLNKTALNLDRSNLSDQLIASYLPADTVCTVAWSSSDPSVAIVDQNGNVIAVADGEALITATAGSVSASCTVTVSGITPKLTLDLTNLELCVTDNALITPFYSLADTTFADYTWSSSDTSIATVDEYGIVTGVGRGSATIRCTYKQNTDLYAECTVKVTQSVVYHLNGGTNAENNLINLAAGQSLKLSAPTKKGYRFDGWYSDKSYTSAVTKVTLAENEEIDLYAKWTKISLSKPKIKSVYTKIGGELTVTLKKKISGAEGYQFVYSTSSSFKSSKKLTTADTSVTFDVKLNTKYYVKVRAYTTDSAGKRVYSSYSTVSNVTSASTKPADLSAVKASSPAKGQLYVAVSSPVKDCYGYQYVIANDADFTVNKQYVNTRYRSYTFKDLPAGTYYVRARTYNKDTVAGGNSYGHYTATIKLKVKSDTPQNLTGITLTSKKEGCVTVKIDAKVESATGYQYVIADNPEFTNKTYVNKTKTSYTFSDLKQGTYYVKARAYIKNSSTKKNTYSKYTAVQTIEIVLADPIPESLIGVKAESTAKGSLKVSVSEPVLSCYGYQYVIASNADFIGATEVDTRKRSHTFENLPKGTYYIKGRTYNQSTKGDTNVYGEFCPTVTLTVESDIPESLIGVKAETTGSGKIKISVTEPVLSCYGYRYEFATKADFSDAKTVDTRYRSYTFSGLSAGTYYLRGCTYDLYDNQAGKIYGVYCPAISFTLS